MSTLVQEAKECLSARGGRMTAQRRLILQALEGMNSHPTAEELYEQLKPRMPDLNLSTVYRTLRWLEGEGLVGSRRLGEGRHERFDLALSKEHHHFICRACQRVIEFDHPLLESIKAQFAEESGADVQSASMVLSGLCAECRKTAA